MTRPEPLTGIRVADFTSMMSGPCATRLLADCGADVIKIEPITGDYMRFRSPVRDGYSSYYGQMNCGKKSIAIDLKSRKGAEIARKIISGSDVVVENYRPGVMRRMGLGYDDLKDQFPELVYCSISGFGQTGPRAKDPAYAPIIHAASGLDLAHMQYNPHLDRPPSTGVFTADMFAAIYAFGAIQTALIHRERYGGGQFVDVSLLSATLNLLVYEFQEAQFHVSQRRPIYRPLKAMDGFVMVAPVNQNNFESLADTTGHPEWKSDARFSTPRAREQNFEQMMALVEAWTLERSANECEDVLMRGGIPCSRYKNVAELVEDEELRGGDAFAQVSDPAGAYLVPNPPFKLSGTPVGTKPWVSGLSQHRHEILRDMAQLSDTEIAALENEGIIGTGTPHVANDQGKGETQ